jgi:hypothetical protein
MAASLAGRIARPVRSWRYTDPWRSPPIRYLMYVLLPAWFVPGVADYDLAHATRSMGWRS